MIQKLNEVCRLWSYVLKIPTMRMDPSDKLTNKFLLFNGCQRIEN